MIEKRNLIDLNIWVGKIEDLDHDQIANDIKNYAKTIEQDCPQYGSVSRGFVQFEDLVMPVTPEIIKLEKTIKDILFNLFHKEYEISDTWAVDLIENQSVISHTHYSNLHLDPSEYYSITYYPQVPEGSAELVFDYNYCNVMNGIYSVKPEVGTFVIFNSYIKHMTSRNKSKESRLVVSMNLGPVKPRVTPNADWSVYWDRPVIDYGQRDS
jgi:ectoine hydroxylase-related dioxygenase (phytanoyl-CoA dioxygenase family)